MVFQPSLSSVLLMSSLLGDSFLVTKLFILSVYFVRCLPLLLVPQFFPPNICFSSPSALFICTQKFSCLSLMVLSRDLLYAAISITSWFDFISVYDSLIILLMYHTSAASSLLPRSFEPYLGFQSVYLGVNFDISVGEDGLHLSCTVSLDEAILFFVSVAHLASGVIVKPKYLKVSTCFKWLL